MVISNHLLTTPHFRLCLGTGSRSLFVHLALPLAKAEAGWSTRKDGNVNFMAVVGRQAMNFQWLKGVLGKNARYSARVNIGHDEITDSSQAAPYRAVLWAGLESLINSTYE